MAALSCVAQILIRPVSCSGLAFCPSVAWDRMLLMHKIEAATEAGPPDLSAGPGLISHDNNNHVNNPRCNATYEP